MATDDWNYLAARLLGDGQIEVVETDLDIDITSITSNLSAPPTMSGTVHNEIKRLKKNGRPIFEPWNTAILAEADGVLRAGGIYRKPTYNGSEWELDIIGFSGYPQGMMYDGAQYFVEVDPLDIFRHIWTHLQSQPGGNLGVTIDPLVSPVRVGKELENVQFTAETSPGNSELVSFEAGPKKLNWYDTTDLGKEIDDYAKSTPFDWREDISWAGDQIAINLALGYPTIGTRRADLTGFVLGINLATEPSIAEADYVNQLHVLGAGEGRDAIRGYAGVADGRLRRTKVVEDKTKKSKRAADALAAEVLAATRGQLTIDTLDVYDHPNAPLQGIQLGDEYPIYAETDWATVDGYVRVVGRSDVPGKSDMATFTVLRSAAA
jgi:hypothetical protein